MASIGLPVPPGFTITTEVCTHYYEHGRAYPEELAGSVEAGVAHIEAATGVRPHAYRAPGFSITPDTPWAFEVLAEGARRFRGLPLSALHKEDFSAHVIGQRGATLATERLRLATKHLALGERLLQIVLVLDDKVDLRLLLLDLRLLQR